MPAVLIIEAMAQTGGVLLLNSVEDCAGKLVYFSGIDQARFRQPVIPGDQLRFELEMVTRDFRAALAVIDATSKDFILGYPMGLFVRPRALMEGRAYRQLGEIDRAREAFETARTQLEERIAMEPLNYWHHACLGVAHAALGNREDALREGSRTVEILPPDSDAIDGPNVSLFLAYIHVLLGDHDAALDQIEILLSQPCWFSTNLLRLEPWWDSLRDHPRYIALLVEYETR